MSKNQEQKSWFQQIICSVKGLGAKARIIYQLARQGQIDLCTIQQCLKEIYHISEQSCWKDFISQISSWSKQQLLFHNHNYGSEAFFAYLHDPQKKIAGKRLLLFHNKNKISITDQKLLTWTENAINNENREIITLGLQICSLLQLKTMNPKACTPLHFIYLQKQEAAELPAKTLLIILIITALKTELAPIKLLRVIKTPILKKQSESKNIQNQKWLTLSSVFSQSFKFKYITSSAKKIILSLTACVACFSLLFLPLLFHHSPDKLKKNLQETTLIKQDSSISPENIPTALLKASEPKLQEAAISIKKETRSQPLNIKAKEQTASISKEPPAITDEKTSISTNKEPPPITDEKPLTNLDKETAAVTPKFPLDNKIILLVGYEDGNRADTICLMNIRQGTVSVLNIPRDSLLSLKMKDKKYIAK